MRLEMFKKRESVIMGGVPMNEISTVSSSKTDLMQQSELYKPMLYYGSKPTIKFDYVSDIHLSHMLPAAHHVEVCKVSSGKAVRSLPQSYIILKTGIFQGYQADIQHRSQIIIYV